MSTVQEIKSAIDRLSLQERCELFALLNPPQHDEWDRQMIADAEPGGKLGRIKEEAHRDYLDGKCAEWPPREISRPS